MSRFATFRTLLITVLLGLAAAPATASAHSTTSTNWAGYAAHKSGVSFHAVVATWTQPEPVCTGQSSTYSAIWTGLGGYSTNSSALEQIGTELDCSPSGRPSSYAWYELVPAPSRRITIKIEPGDKIHAKVTVTGDRVTVKLTDVTRHKSFSKTVNATSVDVTSADWIVEAPSACFNDNFCRSLPLTDFGVVRFRGASAETTTGRRGSVSSPLWGRTRISLVPGGRAYVAFGTAGQAKPSALTSNGSSFEVDYSQATASSGAPPYFSTRASATRPASVMQLAGPRR